MLAPNTVLQNRYLIKRSVGQGGMGAVYEALDQRFDAPVAVKETFFTDERPRKAFEREARLLYGLRHPSLPRVIDHFNESEGQFLVMDFIPGDDLETLRARKGGRFSPVEVLTWADQMLDALEYLHAQEPPIIHRDIKPQNLKLTPQGQIILLDFGLAKGASAAVSGNTTGSLFGYTPSYAPLEQIQGAGTDARSDLYSLAATVYVLLTGVTPTSALTRVVEVHSGQPDPLQPANLVNPQVSINIAAVIATAMSLIRDQRPMTATALRQQFFQAMQLDGTLPAVKIRGSAPLSEIKRPEDTKPKSFLNQPSNIGQRGDAPVQSQTAEAASSVSYAAQPGQLGQVSPASSGADVLSRAPQPSIAGSIAMAEPSKVEPSKIDGQPVMSQSKLEPTSPAPSLVNSAVNSAANSATFSGGGTQSQLNSRVVANRPTATLRQKEKAGGGKKIGIALALLVVLGIGGVGIYTFIQSNEPAKQTGGAEDSMRSHAADSQMSSADRLAKAKELSQPGANKDSLIKAASHLTFIQSTAPEYGEAQELEKSISARLQQLK